MSDDAATAIMPVAPPPDYVAAMEARYKRLDPDYGSQAHQRQFIERCRLMQKISPCMLNHDNDDPPEHRYAGDPARDLKPCYPEATRTKAYERQRSPTRPWWEVLAIADNVRQGLDASELLALVKARYRNAIKSAHPDAGGSHELAAELNAALADAEIELAPNEPRDG